MQSPIPLKASEIMQLVRIGHLEVEIETDRIYRAGMTVSLDVIGLAAVNARIKTLKQTGNKVTLYLEHVKSN